MYYNMCRIINTYVRFDAKVIRPRVDCERSCAFVLKRRESRLNPSKLCVATRA